MIATNVYAQKLNLQSMIDGNSIHICYYRCLSQQKYTP